MSNIPLDTQVTLKGPKGNIVTTLGDALTAAGFVPPASPTAAPTARPQRRIVQTTKPAAQQTKPASSDELLAAFSGIITAPAEQPSVIVPAKQSKSHSDITLYITKELLPGGDNKKEYLCISRTRTNAATGEIKADEKQNFGFDKSFSYHQGEAAGEKWPLKKLDREVGGVKGTFWCRYIPLDKLAVMLEGLRKNFSGATMIIDGKSNVL